MPKSNRTCAQGPYRKHVEQIATMLPRVYISANGTGSPLINSISLIATIDMSFHYRKGIYNMSVYLKRLPNESSSPMVKQTAHPPKR